MKVAATAPRRVAGLYEWLRRTDSVVRCMPPLVDELCVALGLPVADMYVCAMLLLGADLNRSGCHAFMF
jgi:hypothetical protein